MRGCPQLYVFAVALCRGFMIKVRSRPAFTEPFRALANPTFSVDTYDVDYCFLLQW